MKKYSSVLFSLFFSTAFASTTVPPLPSDFPVQKPPLTGFETFGAGLPLSDFLKITLSDMAGRSFVLSPDIGSIQGTISADFTRSKIKDPLPVVRAVLDGLGLQIRDVSGILLVERKPKTQEVLTKNTPPESVRIFKPSHRSVSSLLPYLSVFPTVKFSFSPGIVRPSSSPEAQPPDAPLGASSSTGLATFSTVNADPSFLVAKAPAADLDVFSEYLTQIDQPIPEILLKAFVFEVRDTKSNESAVQLVLNLLGDRFKLSLGSSGSDASSGLRLSFGNLSGAITALTSDSRVKLVSSPVLRASDTKTATATIGTDTPTLGAVVSQNGTTSQSVTYQQSGVILSVTPRILEKSISLDISQELSSFVKTDTGLATTPTKLRRSFKSNAIAQDGETILLGGLEEAQNSTAKSNSFGWFGSDSSSSSTSQIVVMLHVQRL